MMMMRRRRTSMRMTIKTNLGLCILGSCEGDIRAARRCSGFSSPLRELTLLLCYFSFFIVTVYLFPSESWLCFFVVFHFFLSFCHCYFVICHFSLFYLLFSKLSLLLCYLVVFVAILFVIGIVVLIISVLGTRFINSAIIASLTCERQGSGRRGPLQQVSPPWDDDDDDDNDEDDDDDDHLQQVSPPWEAGLPLDFRHPRAPWGWSVSLFVTICFLIYIWFDK